MEMRVCQINDRYLDESGSKHRERERKREKEGERGAVMNRDRIATNPLHSKPRNCANQSLWFRAHLTELKFRY